MMIQHQQAIQVAFLQDLFALLWLSPLVFMQVQAIEANAWWQLLLLGIVFTALAHLLFIRGLKNTKAQTASLISNMEPIYGAFFAWILLDERLSLQIIIGGAMIVIAAIAAGIVQVKPKWLLFLKRIIFS